MVSDQMIALIATAIGSPVLVKIVEAVVKYISGRVSKEARLEQRIDKLKAENKSLEQQVRRAEERVHTLRVGLIRNGISPNDIDPLPRTNHFE
ncbi:hypothetical protein QDX25_07200 [Auritidibacter ignavus]|uniref:hypothetical protein n=1 Tax=Auritidibacter ignavus TaxID=678932 RepID=UPI002446CE92|nr:hypothetical protein [Auritidibacter ignavus]WGH80594.1 hypothetical protein QDX25_07200 [Auritidibacter ignavus]